MKRMGIEQEVLEVGEYLAAAFLKASGVRFRGARLDDSGKRVALLFDNEGGQAARLLDEHRNGGCPVNSAALAAAVVQMKDAIFEARRGR